MSERSAWQDEPASIEPGKEYTPAELEAIADNLLRWDAFAELCPVCDERELDPTADSCRCPAGHRWTRDLCECEECGHIESRSRVARRTSADCSACGGRLAVAHRRKGHGGENPVLLPDHLKTRQSHELFTEVGTPEPEVYRGIFSRPHNPRMKNRRAEAWERGEYRNGD